MNIALAFGEKSNGIRQRMVKLRDDADIDIYNTIEDVIKGSMTRNKVYDRVLILSRLLYKPVNADAALKNLYKYWRSFCQSTEFIFFASQGKDEELAQKFNSVMMSPLCAAILVPNVSIIILEELLTLRVSELAQKYGCAEEVELEIESATYEEFKPEPTPEEKAQQESQNQKQEQSKQKKGLFSKLFSGKSKTKPNTAPKQGSTLESSAESQPELQNEVEQIEQYADNQEQYYDEQGQYVDQYNNEQAQYVEQQGQYYSEQEQYYDEQGQYTEQDGQYFDNQEQYAEQNSQYFEQQEQYFDNQEQYMNQDGQYADEQYNTQQSNGYPEEVQNEYSVEQQEGSTIQSGYFDEVSDIAISQNEYAEQQNDYTEQQGEYFNEYGDFAAEQGEDEQEEDDFLANQWSSLEEGSVDYSDSSSANSRDEDFFNEAFSDGLIENLQSNAGSVENAIFEEFEPINDTIENYTMDSSLEGNTEIATQDNFDKQYYENSANDSAFSDEPEIQEQSTIIENSELSNAEPSLAEMSESELNLSENILDSKSSNENNYAEDSGFSGNLQSQQQDIQNNFNTENSTNISVENNISTPQSEAENLDFSGVTRVLNRKRRLAQQGRQAVSTSQSESSRQKQSTELQQEYSNNEPMPEPDLQQMSGEEKQGSSYQSSVHQDSTSQISYQNDMQQDSILQSSSQTVYQQPVVGQAINQGSQVQDAFVQVPDDAMTVEEDFGADEMMFNAVDEVPEQDTVKQEQISFNIPQTTGEIAAQNVATSTNTPKKKKGIGLGLFGRRKKESSQHEQTDNQSQAAQPVNQGSADVNSTNDIDTNSIDTNGNSGDINYRVVTDEVQMVNPTAKSDNDAAVIEDTGLFNDMNVAALENEYVEEEVAKNTVIERVEVDKGANRAFNNVISGRDKRVFLVTGDRGSGITTFAYNLALEFAKHTLVLYYDGDTENHGLMNYINFERFCEYEERKTQGNKYAKSTTAFKNCVVKYANNLDLLSSQYGVQVSNSEYETVQSTVVDVSDLYNVVVADIPLSKLALCPELVSSATVIMMVEPTNRGMMNLACGFDSSELPLRLKRRIVNTGILMVRNNGENVNIKKLKSGVSSILDFEGDDANWLQMKTMLQSNMTQQFLTDLIS